MMKERYKLPKPGRARVGFPQSSVWFDVSRYPYIVYCEYEYCQKPAYGRDASGMPVCRGHGDNWGKGNGF